MTQVPARYMGPYVLRHALEQRGYSAQVIDFVHYFTGQELYEALKLFVDDSTLCLGLSSTFWNASFTRELDWTNDNGVPPNVVIAVSKIKQEYPKLTVVLGGAKVYSTVKRISDIDFFVVGEAEVLFPELLDHLRGLPAVLETRFDILTRKTYITGHKSEAKFDIAEHAFRWSDRDLISSDEALPLETARGCIFKCKFCSYPGLGKSKYDYLRRVDLIAEEIEDNKSRFGVTHYNLLDDTFNDSAFKVNTWATMVKGLGFPIQYTGYLRADLLDTFHGSAAKLQDTGLVSCFLGLESLNPKAARLVGKGWSGTKAREAVPHLLHTVWESKVNAMLGLIVGLPGESEDDLIETSNWARENDLNPQFYGLNLSRAAKTYQSEFEANAHEYGFTFDSRGLWQHEYWTYDRAHRFASVLNKMHSHRVRVDNWSHTTLLSRGIEHRTLLEVPARDVMPLAHQMAVPFVSRYKRRLTALGGGNGTHDT